MITERVEALRRAVQRTVAFFDTLDYPLTTTECATFLEWEGGNVPDEHEMHQAIRSLVHDQKIESSEDRLALPGRLHALLARVHERTPFFPRKLRVAKGVARLLARNPNVRFVALANTTALAHARDLSDLDFFVVVKQGSLWSTRLLSSGFYKLLGKQPQTHEQRDAICLSYFISDAQLDLSSHLLQDGDDPYFRYWFLALLPLYDDGVSRDLWDANARITSRHPRAERWIATPGISRPRIQIPGVSLFESAARSFQERWFPAAIRERMNRGTDVIVTNDALKFHVDDGRAQYRAQYQERLKLLGL